MAALACFATAQHQALIGYLEQRLLAIEVRLAFCFLLGPQVLEFKREKRRKLLGESAMALECRCGEMLEKFN